jgi:hypothetical protein
MQVNCNVLRWFRNNETFYKYVGFIKDVEFDGNKQINTRARFSLGSSRFRWEDNIKMDLQEVGCGGME